MSEITENIRYILPLTYEEREAAYKKARERLAGKETDIKKFKKASLRKYPERITNIAYSLLLILMVFTFIPSAMSLYFSGASRYCIALEGFTQGQGLQDLTFSYDPRCQIVGVSMVLMAEVGQIVFLVSLAILDTQERWHIGRIVINPVLLFLWSGTILSTIIALVGNAHFGQPWIHGNWVFDYVKTFGPPLLTMGIGFVLKELFLNNVKDNFEITAKYNEAEEQRLRVYNDPESAPNWNRYLVQTLREEIVAKNTRKPQKLALRALSEEEWQYLLRAEYARMNWTVDLQQETKIERVEKARQIATSTAGGKAKHTNGSDGRKEGKDYIYWMNENGLWSGYSKSSDSLVGDEYRDGHAAYMATRNHNRKLGELNGHQGGS